MTRPTSSAPSASVELRRRLGLADVTAIHVGTILGSGIFVAPAAVAAAAPGGLAAAGLWLLGGIIAACGAACYGECGSRLPRTGGFYVYYREVYGRSVAFVGGWVALLVTYPASIAAIALIFGRYLAEILPGMPAGSVGPAAGALILVGAINIVGVRTAAGVQKVLTGAKVLALASVCVAALVISIPARPTGASAPAWELSASLAAVMGAVVVLLWTYDGWSDISLVAGEIREPGRVLGRAVLLGTSILVVVYVIVQLSVATLLSPERAAVSERVVSDAVGAGLGPGSARLVALLVVLSTFGSVHGVVLTASRLGFAMARDGIFLKWFGHVHPRFGTPWRAVMAIVFASLFYVFVAGFQSIVAFFSFSVWIFYGLTAIALLVLRRRRVGESNAWVVPGGGIAPAVVLLTAAGMTTGLWLEDPRRSFIGLAVLVAGFPTYALWRFVSRSRETAG